jgi:hypothetical protein
LGSPRPHNSDTRRAAQDPSAKKPELCAHLAGRFQGQPAVSLAGMENTMKKEVEFDAHKTVKKPTTVEFTTRSGKEVDFTAKKNVRVPVHVSFKAKTK